MTHTHKILNTADNRNRYQALPVHWQKRGDTFTRMIQREGVWFVSARYYKSTGERGQLIPGVRMMRYG